MEDYKLLAHQKYLYKKKATEEEQEKQRKIKEEKEIKELEEIRRQQEEEDKKEAYIQSQILIINESIYSYDKDDTDDNLLLILINIYSSLENIIDIISVSDKENIIMSVVNFTNKVDTLNKQRPKSINTIKNVNTLSDGFKRIYNLLNLDVDIITLDTENDAEIARNLAKPTHLRLVGEYAFKRFQKNNNVQ